LAPQLFAALAAMGNGGGGFELHGKSFEFLK
jgi:hypothetical protein